MKPYLIVTPFYADCCAGIKVLHKLADKLRSNGYEVYKTTDPINYDVGRVKREGVVVYPEIIQGNPLRANNVVRWDLNKPVQDYPISDLIFSYNEMLLRYSKAKDILNIDAIEDFFCKPGVEDRTKVCFWIGKGRGTPMVKETDGAIEITHGWPTPRTELAKLFQESKVFYTYDNFTALIDEARLCGCPVVIIPSGQLKDIDWWRFTLGTKGLFIQGKHQYHYDWDVLDKHLDNRVSQAKQLDNFIAQTQNMNNNYVENYKGVNEEWRSWIPEREFSEV